MNSQPHTHDLRVSDRGSYVFIVYGDTTGSVYKRLGRMSERRLRRAVREVIRRHDAGSVAAGRTADAIAAVVAQEQVRANAWRS